MWQHRDPAVFFFIFRLLLYLSTMAAGVVYSYADNFRAQKAFIAARYSSFALKLADNFTFGETNAEPSFLAKFPSGKVPAFESADGKVLLTESNAIAYYVSNDALRGSDAVSRAQVLQWMSWADSEVYPPSCAWAYPLMGIMKRNPKNEKRGETEILACMKVLDAHLRTRTFLVGERISLADIVVLCTLLNVIRYALTKDLGGQYANVMRWVVTLVNQPEFKAVLGEVKPYELKAASAAPEGGDRPAKEKQPPKEKAPKAEKPKPKKEVEEEEDDGMPKEPQSSNPFDAMPKGTFDMDAFKRCYSNEAETVSIPYFFEKFDAVNYSIWIGEYKYNDELSKVFMSCNLITGMFQRIEKMRKATFASCCLFGKDNDSSISGIWVWRGQELAFPLSPDWQIDYESYDWKKLDPSKPETKALVEQYFSWAGKDKQGREFNQGKIFK